MAPYSLLLGKLFLLPLILLLLAPKFLHLCLQLLRFTVALGRKKRGSRGEGEREKKTVEEEGRREHEGTGEEREREMGRGGEGWEEEGREIWGKHSDQGEGGEERRGEEVYVK